MIFWSLLNWVDFEIFQRHFGSWAIVARVWTRDRPKLIQAYLFMSGNTPDQGFKISWFLGGSISPLIQHTSVKILYTYIMAFIIIIGILNYYYFLGPTIIISGIDVPIHSASFRKLSSMSLWASSILTKEVEKRTTALLHYYSLYTSYLLNRALVRSRAESCTYKSIRTRCKS